MELEIIERKGLRLCLLKSAGPIRDTQDAVDLLMNARYQESDHVIVHREQLVPAFFDLKTTLAGEILQKFSTYRSHLAITGQFEDLSSQSLQQFIMESNRQGRIVFADSIEKAVDLFAR